ncbi:MAG: YeeE/YedE family protein [Rhodospirillales bacterium 20-64-7]|nr:MAG: YeeE/YedE family protein [Rhodospirillales bacterium 20-64-7]HQT75976.1 YeeE/YedE thiosulfate transporter family protein [Rhodopila sp.]
MQHFTPVAATLGGTLIGLSAAILWLGDGRIAGISGIVGPIAGGTGSRSEWTWRLAFLLGLIAAPRIYELAAGRAPRILLSSDPLLLVVAGLLVGFGARLGGGCTSGHGVCGLARLSPRSITATVLFTASAALTVFLTRHHFGI